MKKIDENEIKLLFESNNCFLIGKYLGYDIPMEYRCACGNTGEISLEKFKRRIKRKEGCIYCNVHKWTVEEDEIIKKYYGKESRQFILDKLPNISYSMLKNRAFALKLQGNRSISQKKARINYQRKYSYNLNYFDVIKPETCYWSGFITSKSKIKNNKIIIEFDVLDKPHIEKFQDAVLHTGVVSTNSKKSSLVFYGADNWIDKINKFPSDEINLLAYIRGCIDANGEIKDSFIKIKGKEVLLIWIKECFDKICPSVKKRYAEISKVKDNYVYTVYGKRSRYLVKKMIGIKLPILERKWD